MVTILLPIYNDEKYIKFTIQSLLDQSFSDYKCLIGFNGTTDNSRDIVKSLIEDDRRFSINDFGDAKGKSLTLNKLLDIVDTEFICLIDGDDIWKSDKLEKQINISSQFDIIGTLASYIDENNSSFFNLNLLEDNESIKRELFKGNNQIVNSSCFLKTSCAREVGGWDHSVEGLEDFDFWVKLAKKNKIFFNVQDYLVYHRVHQNSNFNAKKLSYNVIDILIKNKIYAY
jgi:glycosyltransferase involved in cell wall biosynthesis